LARALNELLGELGLATEKEGAHVAGALALTPSRRARRSPLARASATRSSTTVPDMLLDQLLGHALGQDLAVIHDRPTDRRVAPPRPCSAW
jgi:hypothetical protein